LGRPLLDSRKFLQGEKAPRKAAAEDSSALPATAKPDAPESPTSAAPALDLFTEQKA